VSKYPVSREGGAKSIPSQYVPAKETYIATLQAGPCLQRQFYHLIVSTLEPMSPMVSFRLPLLMPKVAHNKAIPIDKADISCEDLIRE